MRHGADKFPHILGQLYGSPWMMLPEKLSELSQVFWKRVQAGSDEIVQLEQLAARNRLGLGGNSSASLPPPEIRIEGGEPTKQLAADGKDAGFQLVGVWHAAGPLSHAVRGDSVRRSVFGPRRRAAFGEHGPPRNRRSRSLLQHASHTYAADLLDLSSPDRLAIRDDGQGLQRGTGEPVRTSRKLRTLDRLRVLGASEDLPASTHFHELDAVSGRVIRLAQLVERRLQRRGRHVRVECSELVERNGARAREERRFKQPG